MTNLFS